MNHATFDLRNKLAYISDKLMIRTFGFACDELTNTLYLQIQIGLCDILKEEYDSYG